MEVDREMDFSRRPVDPDRMAQRIRDMEKQRSTEHSRRRSVDTDPPQRVTEQVSPGAGDKDKDNGEKEQYSSKNGPTRYHGWKDRVNNRRDSHRDDPGMEF